MNQKEKKSLKKSSRNAEKRYKQFKSVDRIFRKLFPSISNTRLRLNLKNKMSSADICKELEMVLELEQNLTDSKVQIANKFHRYKWEIKVKESR